MTELICTYRESTVTQAATVLPKLRVQGCSESMVLRHCSSSSCEGEK